jgi:carbonic anhydrase/acetyltransferase-like protein (isoleucine patch superfamily)
MTVVEQHRAESRHEPADHPAGARLFVVRLLNYLTNHVVNRIPSFAFRRLWYVRVLGAAIADGVGIHLGCYVWFYGPRQVRRDGFQVGARTRIGRGSCLDLRGGVTIGADVSISPEVAILTAAHEIADPGFRVENRRVVIDDNVYIGMRAVVLPGVHIGRGAVVAAGAVVARDVAPLTVVAGVPAKPIASRPENAAAYELRGALPLFE